MFGEDYKNQMDNIKPDGYIKQKVLKQIDKNQNENKPTPKMRVIRRMTAVAAGFAIAFSVFAITSHNKNNVVTVEEKTYSDIYSAVKTLLPKEPTIAEKLYGFINGDKEMAIEDYVLYEEEYSLDGETATIDIADNATNATGKDTGAQKAPSASKDSANKGGSKGNHSETTTQVEGVSEADIVKTDGEYIYYLNPTTGILRIIKAGKQPEALSSTKVISNKFPNVDEMYLVGDRVVVVGTVYIDTGNQNKTTALIYSVKNPQKPEQLYSCEQSGVYNDSRMIGDKLYLISNYYLNTYKIESDKPETYVPSVECGNYCGAVKADTVMVNDVCKRPEYTVICGYSIENGDLLGSRSLLGGIQTFYCNTKNIIVAGMEADNKTVISRYAISDGQIELKATGEIDGYLLNQFSIDEHKDNFRFVTTINNYIERKSSNGYVYEEAVTKNALYVLDKDLKQTGVIKDIAPNERVYSVRFMGDTAYFVTFRQVDPLFSVDLSDPKNPKIIGALKIPGFSNYLFPYGEGRLFGIGQDADERTGRSGGIKLSMFDISNPSNVSEVAKEILEQNYSQALYDHKAILVDSNKNLIGFGVNGYNDTRYLVYSFENGDFRKLAEIYLGKFYEFVRGLYIGNEFYIVSDNEISVYSLNDFAKLSKIEF